MNKRDYRKGALPYRFIPIPTDVLRSRDWQVLPASSKMLALDLMAQYTGRNNGRLCTAYEVMKRCAWKSPHTLINAKRRLLEAPFVIRTRKGHPPRTAEWIAFTWWPLNFERSMDIDPKRFPYLNFVRMPALSVVPKAHHEPDKAVPGRAEVALRSTL